MALPVLVEQFFIVIMGVINTLLLVYRMLRGDWTRRGLIRDSQAR